MYVSKMNPKFKFNFIYLVNGMLFMYFLPSLFSQRIEDEVVQNHMKQKKEWTYPALHSFLLYISVYSSYGQRSTSHLIFDK